MTGWRKPRQTNRQKKNIGFTQAQLEALDPYKYAVRYHSKKSQENGHYYLKKQTKQKQPTILSWNVLIQWVLPFSNSQQTW